MDNKKLFKRIGLAAVFLFFTTLIYYLVSQGFFQKTTFYPNTGDAPLLELKWDGELNPADATRYTPYGIWEGWFEYPDGVAYEPANEMQFYIKSAKENYLAAAPGIVVQKETFNGGSGLVSVRYGKYFGITYMHIFPSDEIGIGDKVEIGDILGKMEKMPNPEQGEETWWEIQVTEYKDGYIRTVPPYQYFSDESKQKLNQIVQHSRERNQRWITEEGNVWTIIDGCSWIKHTKEPAWWSSFERIGYVPAGAVEQSEEDFIASIDSSWKVGDNQGRIIGPTDICR